MFLNDQARRLGDLAAGTLVVHDRAPVTLESLEKAAFVPSFVERASVKNAWPVERLSPADLQVVSDFLGRRETLANREALAARIFRDVSARMELAPEAGDKDPERALVEIYILARGEDDGEEGYNLP